MILSYTSSHVRSLLGYSEYYTPVLTVICGRGRDLGVSALLGCEGDGWVWC